MARFTGIPEIPQGGIDEWQYRVLDSMKQNIELLTNTRNEEDEASVAITRSSITTRPPGAAQFQGLTARGTGFTISGVQVPSLDDYNALLQDFIRLSQDVVNLRATVSTLITQIRGL